MFPIHLDIGLRVFYYYEGLYFLIAILTGYFVVSALLKKNALNVQHLQGSLIWIFFGAILGARSFHFFFWDLKTLLADPFVFFRVWEGGLTITGGLIGGAVGALLYFMRKKVSFWQYFAVASPGVLIAQAVGRVGCFLNGDAWGIPTTLPWGVSQPKYGTLIPSMQLEDKVPSLAWNWSVQQGFTDPSALRTVPLHPTQLYESLGDLVLALVVFLVFQALKSNQRKLVPIFWLHLAGYSLLRFSLEFLHGDKDVIVAGGMTALQIGLLIFGILGTILFITSNKAELPAVPAKKSAGSKKRSAQ